MLTKEQTDEINNRINRFIYLMKEGESSEGITSTYPTPGIEVIKFSPQKAKAPTDKEYTERIRKSLEELLKLAPTTQSFKRFIEIEFVKSYDFGSDTESLINYIQGWIDPHSNLNTSIFNQGSAKIAEHFALLTYEQLFRMPWNNKKTPEISIEEWKREIESLYK